jgi:hypothetical protein
MDKYRIMITLSEPEFLALARSGYKELRSPRNQARYLVRQNLISLGLLTDHFVEPINPPKGAVS